MTLVKVRQSFQLAKNKFKSKRSRYSIFQIFLWALYKFRPGPFKAIAETGGPNVYDLTPSHGLNVDGKANADSFSLELEGLNRVYDSLPGKSTNVQLATPGQKRILWVVPDWTNVWGGGHYTIFRFANYFASSGWQSDLFIYDNSRHGNGLYLERQLNDAVPNCNLRVFTHENSLPSAAYDAVVATTWQSAYWVKSLAGSAEKFYLMQDFESIFYPGGTSYLQAEYTYEFGFHGITGGEWLKSIYERYGSTAMAYKFAVDHAIFYPGNERSGDQSSLRDIENIFFYARPSTERRCYELGVCALKLIADKYPDINILVAGLDDIGSLPFKAEKLGNLPIHKTADLYRACDLGIALSGSNLSYLPLELMACGCPVISNKGPQVEWFLKHMQNSYLVPPVPSAFLQAFEHLKDNHELRKTLVARGIQEISENTWEAQCLNILKYVTLKTSR